MVENGIRPYGIDVPCHVEKQFKVVGGGLQFVYIGNPQPSRVVVVSLAHLVVDESRLRCREPQVVVRPAPVAQMVIHSCPTLSFLLQRVAQACHVAVVVVAPCQHHVVGHHKPVFHHLQHLFVWYKLLWNPLHIFVYIFSKHRPLVVNHLLQCCGLVVEALAHSLHSSVVNATHTYGVDVLIPARLLQPFGPVVLHALLIYNIVVGSTRLGVPFPHVVAHHRLAVRRAYHYAAGVCRLLRSFHHKERSCRWVHGRPDGVCPQSHQQFKHLFVCRRAYQSRFGRRKSPPAPGQCGPVLVVYKNAAVFHRRALHRMEVGRNLQCRPFLRHLVSPPFPWRHTSHARQFEYSVCSATPVAARHCQLSSSHLYAESVFPLLQCLHVYASRPECLFGSLVLVHLHYAHPGSAAFLFQFCPCHVHHVLAPHLHCRCHHWRHAFAQRVADVRSAVVPAEHVFLAGGLSHGGNAHYYEA